MKKDMSSTWMVASMFFWCGKNRDLLSPRKTFSPFWPVKIAKTHRVFSKFQLPGMYFFEIIRNLLIYYRVVNFEFLQFDCKEELFFETICNSLVSRIWRQVLQSKDIHKQEGLGVSEHNGVTTAMKWSVLQKKFSCMWSLHNHFIQHDLSSWKTTKSTFSAKQTLCKQAVAYLIKLYLSRLCIERCLQHSCLQLHEL